MTFSQSSEDSLPMRRSISTNKTVTIPRWLDMLARKEKVNYSHLLQESLKNYLGLQAPSSPHFRSR